MNRTALTAILSIGVLVVGGFVGLAHADVRVDSPGPAGPDVNGIVATIETTLAGAGVPVDLPEAPALPAAPALPDVKGVVATIENALDTVGLPVGGLLPQL